MRFRVLGQLDVRDDGPMRVGGHRQQLVLAVLLDRANERISTSGLIDAVWGEAPPATARKTLQAYVSRLRALLGADLIETIADGYRLGCSDDELDRLRFEALALSGARALDDDPGRAAPLLHEALDLWRGAPYGALGEEPALRASATRLLERRLEVLEHRVEADLATGRDTGLAAELEALVTDHPVRESLHRLRMVVLYRQGRQAEALAVARDLRGTLADELGLEPSPAVQELQARILDQDPTLLGPVDGRARGDGRRGAAGEADPVRGQGGAGQDGAGSGDGAPNPYRGLEPFTEDTAGWFFGREDLTAELVARTEQSSLVVVVGPSGSGKSSVVRAGLLPALRRRQPDWAVATMRPGAHPFAELEALLLRAVGTAPPSLADQFRGDELDVLRAVLRVVPDDHRLLLVVDQLEELFVLADAGTRDRFARGIVEAIEDPNGRLTVVATVRADFLDHPLQHTALGPYVERASVLVPPLRPTELEAAMVGPARAVGVGVAPELVAQVVGDVASEPASLPLFQYALTELFDQRAGGPLTLTGYRRLGGLEGALARRGDELLARLDDDERAVARQVLLRLVAHGHGDEGTRRRATRSELDALPLPTAAVTRVVEQFGDARLLVFDRDAVTGAATVEVAHEALLRDWPTLRGWIDAARADLQLRHALVLAEREWTTSGERDDFLLTGGRLEVLDDWRARSVVELTEAEERFLRASREHDAAARAGAEARREHELDLERSASRRLRQLVAVLAVAAIVAAGLGLLATDRATRAEEAEQLALVEQQLARARQLARVGQTVVGEDPALGLLLALHAVRMHEELDVPLGPDDVATLHWALQDAGLAYPDGHPVRVVATPDGARGLYALPVSDLVALIGEHVDRRLTPAECDTYLDQPTCPDPLPADLGLTVAGEQPGRAATDDAPMEGTSVTLLSPDFRLTEGSREGEALRAWTGRHSGGVELLFDREPNAELILGRRAALAGVDLVEIAQPGFFPAWATSGELPVKDIASWTATDATAEHLLTLATVGPRGAWPSSVGSVLGIPSVVDVKGIVWYSRSAFRDAGYRVPEDYDELLSLARRMAADGRTPFCLGLSSHEFSGWPATDVVEALVLADVGPGGYDAWLAHDVRFTDPPIRRALDRYAELVLAPGHVTGGDVGPTEASQGDAVDGIVDDPATCMMAFGSAGMSGAYPPDADWFSLPPVTSAGRGTVLGSATYLVALHDRPEVRAAVDALFAPGASVALATTGTLALSANEELALDDLPQDDLPGGERTVRAAAHLQRALTEDSFRFDASDLMPEPVWRAFNAGMVRVTDEGPAVIDEVLAGIDAAWDEHLAGSSG